MSDFPKIAWKLVYYVLYRFIYAVKVFQSIKKGWEAKLARKSKFRKFASKRYVLMNNSNGVIKVFILGGIRRSRYKK